MKKSYILVLLLLTALASTAYPVEELICPDSNPENCYPKIFHPTKEWQPVKQGQEIPGGLHIRVNMDTQTKEAKLLDELKLPPSRELQVVGDANEILDSPQQVNSYTHKTNSKLSKEEKDDFGNAVYWLDQFVQSPSTVSLTKVYLSLSSLDELSHDIDFGIKISDGDIFSSLLQMSDILPLKSLEISTLSQSDYDKIKEQSLTIIAATLRNNPIAVQNALKPEHKPSYVINRLLNGLLTTESKITQKRILGVISGLINSREGTQIFKLNDGENRILILFNKLSPDAQKRAFQILDDLRDPTLIKRSKDVQEEDLTLDQVNNKVFAILSDKLSGDSNHSDFKKLFMQLVNLKQTSHVKVDSQFLNWLIDEIQRRKNDPELVRRDNEDSEHGDSESFAEYMLRMRHTVFGNPMGLRKAMADEL